MQLKSDEPARTPPYRPLMSLTERLDPAYTALLVVDMQNDFCAEGGYVARMGRDVSASSRIVPRLRELIAAARRHGVPVYWIVAEYDPDKISAAMRAKQIERGGEAVCCAHGSWGAQFFGVAPQPGDPVIVKHSFSGFHGTRLEEMLRERNIFTLVIAGVQTNVCVDSTVREAHSRGFYVVVAEDCVASHMPEEHLATLSNVRFLLGDVADASTIEASWATYTAEHASK